MMQNFLKIEEIPCLTLEQLKEGYPQEDPVCLYLNEIGHLEILSREQEQLLTQRMIEGSKEAREQLIEHNLLRVAAIARKYRGRGMCGLDLLEEGNNGLIQAAEQYRDIDQCPFAAFAAGHIHRAIRSALNQVVIDRRIPDNIREIMERIHGKGYEK